MNADKHRSKLTSREGLLRGSVSLWFVSLAIGATACFAAAMKSALGWMALGGFIVCCFALATLMQPRVVAGFRMGFREFAKASGETRKALRDWIDGR